MKTRFKTAVFATVCCAALVLSGCGGGGTTPVSATTAIVTDPQTVALISTGITGATELGVQEGLSLLAKSNPTAATESAAALQKSINTDFIPYLNGGKLATAAEIQALMNSSLLANVDPLIRDAVASASNFLQVELPAPTSTSYLTPTEITYVSAFLTGVSKGCADFSTKSIPKPRWVKYSK